MCCASTSVIVAVVQCASSVGGSPRLPTLRTPPFFWAAASGTEAVRQSASTVSVRIAHAVFRWLMGHLRGSEDLIEKSPGALFARAAEERLRVAGLHDHALVHEDDAVGDLAGEAHLVGDHDHGHALAGEVEHDVEHLVDDLGIERAGGLVEEHHLGPHGPQRTTTSPSGTSRDTPRSARKAP